MTFSLGLFTAAGFLLSSWAIISLLPFIYDVEIGTDSLDLVLFRTFRVLKVKHSEIASIKIGRVRDFAPVKLERFFNLSLVNRPFSRRVLVRKTSGIFPILTFTPRDADKFVETVLSRMRAGRASF